MGWVPATENNTSYERIKLLEGESFEGVYNGPKVIDGINGEFRSHEFEKDDDNTIYSISGAALDRSLAKIQPGTLVRLTYKGMTVTKAKRTCKVYDVEVYTDDNGKAKSTF